MKKYVGFYASFDKPLEVHGESTGISTVDQLKENIENASGWGGGSDDCKNFKDYETAWIYEYNHIGRNTVTYYFSMKDREWKRSENEITSYMSWREAKEPFKFIAEWLLDVLGYKQYQQEKLDEFTKKVQLRNSL